MTNEKTEGGFTQVPNVLLEALQRIKLNGSQLRIINCIIRNTIGFKRNTHKMSSTFISKATDINIRQVNRELKSLLDLNVVVMVSNGDRTTAREIGINLDVKLWDSSSEVRTSRDGEIDSTVLLDTTVIKDSGCSGEIDLKVVSKKTDKKEILNKNSNKNIYTNELEVLDHWNSKSIIVHKETTELLKVISKAVKSFGKSEIINCITRYSEILRDDAFFFDYKWSLKDFLTRKNGLPDFTDEGSK